MFTNVIYLIIMLVSVVYFSERQMLKTIWGSINLLKIIKYPFLERLEFIAIPVWMFVVFAGNHANGLDCHAGSGTLIRVEPQVYRSSVRHSNLSREKWHTLFPEAKIESRVQVNLVRTGTIE
ncbi:GerAB/ArcD/ProY family transporter [Paenibacillus apiarius]|uniref:GerAB/ArcD/ProY family transporter n=1 Tax=Paenibacillus apiarius TaxID=46240 RepID=UPI002342C16F|nr:GerAB/ArcD/ProY family transporter [Paenibacillus apiarius]